MDAALRHRKSQLRPVPDCGQHSTLSQLNVFAPGAAAAAGLAAGVAACSYNIIFIINFIYINYIYKLYLYIYISCMRLVTAGKGYFYENTRPTQGMSLA